MKIRAQIGMVLNLDKCIGCHTCSITCKNVWTNRDGVEYAWFNNVESKPGVGYPIDWENQSRWKGGWVRKNGRLIPRIGGKVGLLSKIFANPNMPQIDDYYDPYDLDYDHLQKASNSKAQPIARPYSKITGLRINKIQSGPNWEDDLSGDFATRSKDSNFADIAKDIYGKFEQTFLAYLPRLCEHCLNPACVATCPSGAIYKREEDGIVLIDQDKCRGWRMCVSGCPYKKIYFNWKSGKSEKCIFCYPRIEAGLPTLCAETCVGRIRYLGVILYDADRISEVANSENETDLYQKQLSLYLDPLDPAVIEAAKKAGIAQSVLDAAQRSPVYKLAIDWQLALPLHPEYRTLPMVWYVPPLSPIQSAIRNDDNVIPTVDQLRIPAKYLANLLTAGDPKPVIKALQRMIAMRQYKRSELVEQVKAEKYLQEVGLTEQQVQEMYHYLAIANYEDRYVIPTNTYRDFEKMYGMRGGCGFSFDAGRQGSDSNFNLFDTNRIDVQNVTGLNKE